MKHLRSVGWMALLLVVGTAGCAELEDPAKVEISAHAETWFEVTSPDFHGAYVGNLVEQSRALAADEQRTGTEACRSCHGDLGLAAEDQCLRCHATGRPETGGHPDFNVWLAPANPGFHGVVIAQAMGSESCQTCHGLDDRGGWTGVSCFTCHGGGANGHAESSQWSFTRDNPADPSNRLAPLHTLSVASGGNDRCQACHGADFDGGWSEQSCFTCHAGGPSGHPAASDWIFRSGSRFHGDDDILRCQSCHGADYLGGTSGQTCTACHSWPFGS